MSPLAGLNPAMLGLQYHLGNTQVPWAGMQDMQLDQGAQTWGSPGNMFAPGAAAPPPMQVAPGMDPSAGAAAASKMPVNRPTAQPQGPKTVQVQMMPGAMPNAAPTRSRTGGGGMPQPANPAMAGLSRSLRGRGQGVY